MYLHQHHQECCIRTGWHRRCCHHGDALLQWFLALSKHQNHLQGLLKQIWEPQVQSFYFSRSKFAFPASSQKLQCKKLPGGLDTASPKTLLNSAKTLWKFSHQYSSRSLRKYKGKEHSPNHSWELLLTWFQSQTRIKPKKENDKPTSLMSIDTKASRRYWQIECSEPSKGSHIMTK